MAKNHNGFLRVLMMSALFFIMGNLFAIDFEVNGITYYTGALTNTTAHVTGKAKNYTGAIVIPESVYYQGKNYEVVGIDDDAFYGCDDITSISFPRTIKYIHESAFSGCVNIESVYIPSLEMWLGIDFEEDGGVVNPLWYARHLYINGIEVDHIDIPDGETHLWDKVFTNFKGLKSISLPNSVKMIADTFAGCNNLELVESKIVHPENVSIDKEDIPFDGISPNAKLVVPKGTINSYLAIPKWRDYFYEIVEESDNYNLSITANGNGKALYNGRTVRNSTSTFTIDNGTSAIFTFTPDNGYRIKTVKVNGIDVTSSISNNSYTISTIRRDMTIEVTFEAIPSYTLSIKSNGGGLASYNGTAIRSKTTSFTVNEGTSVAITLTPDIGYRIKSVKENDMIVTPDVLNGTYTINSIKRNTNVEVEFEAITHTLDIVAGGNGNVNYNSDVIRNQSKSYSIQEGSSVILSFVPDTGYKIASVKLNNTEVISSVTNNRYVINNITANTTCAITFEAIPPTTYAFTISAVGNGSVTYDGNTIRGKTSSFTVVDGTNAVVRFYADEGNRLKSVKLGNTDITSSVVNNQYTISNIKTNTSLEVTFEAIPTYSLNIAVSGNGSATYNGTTVRGKTQTFTVIEGTSATITFAPDADYKIASVKLNNTDVTASVVNNSYTIRNMSTEMSLEVEFQRVIYSLSVNVDGNGSVMYDNYVMTHDKTNTFSVVKGASATLTITADANNRIKSLTVNSVDVTANITNGKYTISDIKENTVVDAVFEAIPTYTLTIIAKGNGVSSYGNSAVREHTGLFTVTEGSNATVTFIPDNGYRIKHVKVDGMDVTTIVTNSQYTIRNINKATSLEVEFEEIPPVMFTLSITSKGNGSASCEDTMVRGKTNVFTVTAGASALVTFSSDEGYRILSVKLNGADITANVFNNQYTIVNIGYDTSLEVEFAENVTDLTQNGINYKVVSYIDATLNLASGDYGLTLSIPATISAKNRQWKVVGVEANALSNCFELAAIEWNPDAKFNGNVDNPNLLLYVKKKEFASEAIQNVVVNDEAEEIVLQEAGGGNNFYCSKAFMAKKVLYEHNYSMKSGYNTCQGWETIVLPFDVTKIQKQDGTELLPYQAWMQGGNQRPFWLYSLTELGWKAESSITANTPYIISMPNNEMYNSSYNLSGIVQFIGTNVQVKASMNLGYGKEGNKKLMPNYQNKEASPDCFVLNVNNQWNRNTDAAVEGSVFTSGLRQIHPFEAYMTIDGSAVHSRIPVFKDDVTDIPAIPMTIDTGVDVIYNLNGQRVRSMSRGIYIKNGKKVSIH